MDRRLEYPRSNTQATKSSETISSGRNTSDIQRFSISPSFSIYPGEYKDHSCVFPVGRLRVSTKVQILTFFGVTGSISHSPGEAIPILEKNIR